MKISTWMLGCAIAISSCTNDNSNNTKTAPDTANISPGQETSKEEAVQEIHKMESAAQNATIEVRPFKSENGWGYDIYMNDKMYIHQPHIPAISGNKTFKSETDARKAGELVAHKVKNNIMPPSVTTEELDSIGVLK